MDSNMTKLDDIYQIVWASNSKRREDLLEFISDLIDKERGWWDIDNLHDPEFNMRSYLNG